MRRRARRDVGGAKRSAVQGHGHPVGPVVADWEVDRGGGRVVVCIGAQEDEAQLCLLSHRQVAGDRDRVGRDPALTRDGEGLVHVGGEHSAQPGPDASVEDAGRRQGHVGGARGVGREVAGHVEHDLGVRQRAGRDVGGAQGSVERVHGNSDAVGPVVADREVQRRAGGIVVEVGAEIDEAQLCLLSHRQVAGDRDRVGRDTALTRDQEGAGHVRGEDSAEARPDASVEDAGRRRQGHVGGAREGDVKSGRAGRRAHGAGDRVAAADGRTANVEVAGAGAGDRERDHGSQVSEVDVGGVKALGLVDLAAAGHDRGVGRGQGQVIRDDVEGVELAVARPDVENAAADGRRGLDVGADRIGPCRRAGGRRAVGVEAVHSAVGGTHVEHVIRARGRGPDRMARVCAPERGADAAGGAAVEVVGIDVAVVGPNPDAAVTERRGRVDRTAGGGRPERRADQWAARAVGDAGRVEGVQAAVERPDVDDSAQDRGRGVDRAAGGGRPEGLAGGSAGAAAGGKGVQLVIVRADVDHAGRHRR